MDDYGEREDIGGGSGARRDAHGTGRALIRHAFRCRIARRAVWYGQKTSRTMESRTVAARPKAASSPETPSAAGTAYAKSISMSVQSHAAGVTNGDGTAAGP